MTGSAPPIAHVFRALTTKLCYFSDAERGIALTLYRELLAGDPVSEIQLAAAADCSPEDIRTISRASAMASMISRNSTGDIVGFGGLAVTPTKHRFRVDGRLLYTWCAWDALFLVDALNVTATIESTCPETGAAIVMMARRDGIGWVEPSDVVVSFVLPAAPLFDQSTGETIGSFCHYVHFFASTRAAIAWTARHKGTFVLTLSDAFRLGQLNNDERFGSALNRIRG